MGPLDRASEVKVLQPGGWDCRILPTMQPPAANARSVERVPGVIDQDEADLIRRCRDGDARACRDLVRRYERPVYTVLMRVVRRREDAEDLTQETFVKAFRALDRFDLERPFAAWIFTIASRLAIDSLRRRRVKTVSLQVAEPGSHEERTLDVEDPGPLPDEIVADAQEEGRTAALIAGLPEHYRIVVMLRHQQDLSYEEIAEALQLPLGTVKARIHRARALLKDRLQGTTP